MTSRRTSLSMKASTAAPATACSATAGIGALHAGSWRCSCSLRPAGNLRQMGPLPMGPPPRPPCQPLIDFNLDEAAHWNLSSALAHPDAKMAPLEPALERLLLLVEDGEEDLHWWLEARQPHVRAVYTTPDKRRPTQVPVILHLLTLTGYPDVAGITEDLTEGFQMLGRLRPGPGWTSRRDSKYSDAAPAHQFRNENYLPVHQAQDPQTPAGRVRQYPGLRALRRGTPRPHHGPGSSPAIMAGDHPGRPHRPGHGPPYRAPRRRALCGPIFRHHPVR